MVDGYFREMLIVGRLVECRFVFFLMMRLQPVSRQSGASAASDVYKRQVQEIDGHSFPEIFNAVGQAKAVFGRPSVIIAHTIPGKGVSGWERKYEWHGKTPNAKEAEQALKEIE